MNHELRCSTQFSHDAVCDCRTDVLFQALATVPDAPTQRQLVARVLEIHRQYDDAVLNLVSFLLTSEE